jgi:hypothetical protein
MSESLIIKDGNANIKSLQVDSGSNGYISNHTIVSTVTGAILKKYYADGPDGWNWGASNGSVQVATYNQSRKSLVISNNTPIGKCYVIMGTGSFGEISDVTLPPPNYTFLLDSGGVYFSEIETAALEHLIYIPSSSLIGEEEVMNVTVTEIY